jgi:Flp pilus assembly protein TadD
MAFIPPLMNDVAGESPMPPKYSWPAQFFVALAVLTGQAQAQQPPAQPAQGKVVALNGRVEHTQAAEERWTAARMLQPLLAAERVRTLAASRASILFIDETQVKLNAGAVLTIRQVRTSTGPESSMELQRGEAWFRTKNPRSGLTIQTPAAAAAVRGTEINLRVSDAGESVLTVVEGAVEFSNPQGSIVVNAGEEGTALPGQAPTKRVVLNPENAVQWALYYPVQVAFQDLAATAGVAGMGAGFDRLRAGDAAAALQAFQAAPNDPWARLGTSIAYLSAGDAERARAVIADPFSDAAAEAERSAQLAAVALANGDTAAARREIDAALAKNPTALRPLVLLSSIELRQNRPDAAQQAAERALSAHPQSVGALTAASEAAQSRFDLDAARDYLDRALDLDPRDVHALVNRARIRFGTDDTEGAREDADRAATISPDDPQVRSLRGFIRLAEGDVNAARADFEAAAQRDPEFGEPHLGLGLAFFRENRVNEGLEEMLTATLLEPHVALYQSYLGKAYYQARRFPEGLSALASAKRLDPRDPTPWLYASFFLRDQNEQVAALNELRHAIALNDHRAVYRSRLLLDRDLATKNVSLAQIYRQLGFEAWGAFEALNSLDTDLTNSSAHLFLAETYGGLPDRTEALGSELLQYFLYAPVNRNSFNSFSEYTALIEQPRRQLDIAAEAGSRERGFANVAHRSGNERFAHVAFFQASRESGSRLDRDDDRLQGFFQGKLSFTSRSDLFLGFNGVRDNAGASETATRVFGQDIFNSIILRQFTTTPDRTLTNRFRQAETTVGLKHQWRVGSAFTAAVRYEDLEQTEERPASTTSCNGLDLTTVEPFATFGARSARTIRSPFQVFDVQFQQATRIGRHQLIAGHQFYTLDKASRCSETFSFELLDETFDNEIDEDAHDTGQHTYVRDEVQIAPWLHASIGVGHQHVSYSDSVSGQVFDVGRWSPRLGVGVRLSPSTLLRAAAFKQLHINLFASNIAPPTVAGFVVARNDFPTAKRDEYSLSLEHGARRAFVAVRGFRRDTTVPYLLEGGTFIPESDASGIGGSFYVNWIVNDRLTLFGDDQLFRFDANQFDRYDNLARIGLNAIHPSGIFVRVTGSHLNQRFTKTAVQGLPRSGFAIADVSVSYEFAGKRGLASFQLTNALNQRFDAIIEGLSIGSILPRRRALATMRWRLW